MVDEQSRARNGRGSDELIQSFEHSKIVGTGSIGTSVTQATGTKFVSDTTY